MKARYLLSAILILFCALSIGLNVSQASENLPLHQKGSQHELEKANIDKNIGKIIFTRSAKPLHLSDELNVISTLDLNNDKNAYFTIFLKQPLTPYLRELAPELTTEELNNKGNFQFAFYVDNNLIYTENLNFGAGLAKEKSNNTVLTKPFFSESNEDSWGRFLWMRFMHFGGQASLTGGQHELIVEVRPYLKAPDISTGKIIANGKVSIAFDKPIVTEAQIAVQVIKADSGWEVSNDTFDKEKIRALNTKIAQNELKSISSIVVIKDGALLIEEYFNAKDRESLHDPRSVGKSFASSVMGIAIHEGYIADEDTQISAFYDLKGFSNYTQRKANVTLKDLLTMSSGFDGDDTKQASVGNEENMYPTKNWVKFTLDLPMRPKSPASEPWTYFTAGATLLGDILHKSVPGGLEAYADKTLFSPLGIEYYEWQHTPQKVANTAGGLRLRALDFAKYGQLYKNGGVWGGKQIIPANWVKASLSKQVARTDDVNGGHYGYLFWHDTIPFGDKLLEVAYASGNGGNYIYIFKDVPFVIVITATAYNKPYAHGQVNQMMGKYLLPGILNKAAN
jgi:CubicO group peptidase (beta-lactamase class C family)